MVRELDILPPGTIIQRKPRELQELPQGAKLLPKEPTQLLSKPKGFTQQVSELMGDSEFEKAAEKGIAVAGSRIAEGLLGTPGNVQSLLQQFGLLPKETPYKLPTTEQLKAFSEDITKGYTAQEGTQRLQEFATDIGSMLAGPGGANIMRAVGVPLAGQLAKEGIKRLKKTEKTQDLAKLGGMVIVDLLLGRGRGTRGVAYEYLNTAENSIPINTTFRANNLRNSLLNLENSINTGLITPAKRPALESIRRITNDLMNSHGQIDPRLFPILRRDINELIDANRGFKIDRAERLTQERTLRHLNRVKSEIINTGLEYGRRRNPTFLENWQNGNEMLFINRQSQQMSDILGKLNYKNPITQHLIFLHNPSLYIAAKGAQKAISPIARPALNLFRSPAIRQRYMQIMQQAVMGNAGRAQEYVNKLDQEIEKQMK